MACHAEQITADIGSNPTALEERFQDMTGNTKVWRAPLAGLASVAMIATMGVTALSANAATASVTLDANGGKFGNDTTKTLKDSNDNGFADELYPFTGADNGATWVDSKGVARVFTGWYASATYGGQAVDPTTVEAGATLYAHWTTSSKEDASVWYQRTIGSEAAVKAPAILSGTTTATKDKIATGNGVVGDDGAKTRVVVSSADEVADWQKPTVDQPGDAKLFQGAWNGSGTTSKPYTPATVAAATVKVELAAPNEKVYDQNGKDVTIDATATGTDVAAGETVAALSVLNPAVQNNDGSYGVVVKWVDRNKNNEEFVFGTDGTKVEKGRTYLLAKSDASDAVARAWHIFNAQSGDARQDFYVLDGSNFDPSALKATAERATSTGKYTFSGSWFSKDDILEFTPAFNREFALTPSETYGLTAFAADAAVSGNLTLVPAYTKNADEDLEYTFSFDPYYDGSAAATEVKVKGSDTIYDKVPTPTREGYKFVGWFGDESAAKAAANNSDAKNEADRADRLTWLKDETKTVSDFKSLFTVDSNGDLEAKTYYAGWKLDQINAADFKNLVLLTNSGTYTNASFRVYKSIRTDLLKTIKSETGIDFTGDTSESSVTAKAKKLTAADLLKYGKVLVDAKNNLVKVTKLDQSLGQYGFTDVNVLTPHAEDISTAAEQGFVKGYADNTYRPSATILRQDFAAMLYRLAGSPAYTVSASDNVFSDVTPATPHYKEILWAAKNGIIKGYPDGTFGGTRTVVRQDAMAFLYRVSAYVDADSVKNVEVENTFSDIDTTAHSTEVLWAANYKGDGDTEIAKGYTDGNFHGLWNLTRADAAAFLARADACLGK